MQCRVVARGAGRGRSSTCQDSRSSAGDYGSTVDTGAHAHCAVFFLVVIPVPGDSVVVLRQRNGSPQRKQRSDATVPRGIIPGKCVQRSGGAKVRAAIVKDGLELRARDIVAYMNREGAMGWLCWLVAKKSAAA